MNLCADGHEEVCFEGRNCPVCEIRSDLNAQIEDLNTQIEDLSKEVSQLESKVDNAREGLLLLKGEDLD